MNTDYFKHLLMAAKGMCLDYVVTVDYAIAPGISLDDTLIIKEHSERMDKVLIDLSRVKLISPPATGDINFFLNRLQRTGVFPDIRIGEECILNPEKVPKTWKDKEVRLLGTKFIYENHKDKSLWCPNLYWIGGKKSETSGYFKLSSFPLFNMKPSFISERTVVIALLQ